MRAFLFIAIKTLRSSFYSHLPDNTRGCEQLL
jgi:hypothetical protein